jgi:hypothetical protein
MNRREFLKGTAAAGAAAVLPISILPASNMLPGAKNLGSEQDAKYFRDKLFEGFSFSNINQVLEKNLPLRMFNNGYDWIIAKSQEDAESLLIEMMYPNPAPKTEFLADLGLDHLGIKEWEQTYDPENQIWGWYQTKKKGVVGRKYGPIFRDEVEGDGWREMDMDEKMSVYDEDTGETTVKTVFEWIEEAAPDGEPCYFVTTEY